MIWAFLIHSPNPWLSHFITSLDLQLKFAGSIVIGTINKGVFWLGTEVKDTKLKEKKWNIDIKMKSSQFIAEIAEILDSDWSVLQSCA